jgi:Ricin-type beta-trefoil lectin domain-like
MRQLPGRSSRPRARLLAAALTAVTLGFAALIAGTPAHAFAPAFRTVKAYPTSGQFYNIVSEKDGRCIDVRDAGTGNGTLVQEFDCGTQWNQQFKFVSIGTVNGLSAWRIKPRYLLGTGPGGSDKCLDVINGSGSVNMQLQVWDCSNGWQQMFHIGGTPTTIQPVYDGLCLNEGFVTNGSYNGWGQYAFITQEPCPVGGGPYTMFWQFGQW